MVLDEFQYHKVGRGHIVYNFPGTAIVPESKRYKDAYPIKDTICNIEGCDKKVTARAHVYRGDNVFFLGLCGMHNAPTNISPMGVKERSTLTYLRSYKEQQDRIDTKKATKVPEADRDI